MQWTTVRLMKVVLRVQASKSGRIDKRKGGVTDLVPFLQQGLALTR